jgi:hypothetical protein
MLLLGGCSNSADGGTQADQRGPSQEVLNPSEQANWLANDQSTKLVEPEAAIVPAGPELSRDVTVRQADGTSLLVQGSAVTNETIGYYLYIPPGYRSTIHADTGTMTISRGNGAEAVIEALPPQADAQLAAEDLWNLLQQLDENARQLTEYARYEEWADTYIYRAYRNEERVTAMIRTVDDLLLRITITEPADIDELRMMMAMIASLDTDDIRLLTQADETFARSLITEAYRMQLSVMEHFGLYPKDEAETANASNNESPDEPSELPEVPQQLPLSEVIRSRDDVLAMLEHVYTSDAALTVADMLGIVEFGGVVGASATVEGTKLLWDQVNISLISETDTSQRYLLRVPFDLEGTFKLYEMELRKQADGWRIHTPLTTHAAAPAAPEA